MKKLMLLISFFLINSCTTVYDVNQIFINTETSDKPEKRITEALPRNTEKEHCYMALDDLVKEGTPEKPNIVSNTDIDTALLKALKTHRDYIKRLMLQIQDCQDK